jgi:hypothetical protein
MNRYLIICRLRWPAVLLLTGVLALLDQAHILDWGKSWPLYLILFGVLALAERAVMASQPPPVNPMYPYAEAYPVTGYGAAAYPGTLSGAGSGAVSADQPAHTTTFTGTDAGFHGSTGEKEEGR